MKATYKNKIVNKENDVLIVGVQNGTGDYIMWQRGLKAETGSNDGIYFEYTDQRNGDYDIVAECTVTNDGIHIVLSNGELVHFYFPPGFDKFKDLQIGLERIYSDKRDVLEFII
jgi:hypothetical protein